MVLGAAQMCIRDSPGAVRERGSGNRPLNGEVPTVANGGFSPYTQNAYTIPFSLSYEVDLFGRVRNNVAAVNASLQSTAADLQNVQLCLLYTSRCV